MRVAIIRSSCPEIIKMSYVINKYEKCGIDHYILHTDQHYSYEMDRIFFEQLQLPVAKYNLDVVQGDTNVIFAGAQKISKLHIKIGHVEAGLRNFDRSMPEEINKVIADHILDYLFAPTENSKKYLLDEGIPEEKIFVTGNTVVDAVYQNLEISKQTRQTLLNLNLKKGEYFLTTVHREENTDKKERLSSILASFDQIYNEFNLPITFPAHPRTVKMITEFGLEIPEGTKVINPVGYLDFLQLEGAAKLVLTDSGGLQEESCILGVPCITLRDNTERPETVM